MARLGLGAAGGKPHGGEQQRLRSSLVGNQPHSSAQRKLGHPGLSHYSGFMLSHLLGLRCLFMYKPKGVTLVPWPWQYLTKLARNGFCQKIFSPWASLVSQG